MTAALQVAPCPPAVLRHVRVCTVVHRAGQPSCRLQALHRVDQEVPAVFEPLIRFFLETGKTHRLGFSKKRRPQCAAAARSLGRARDGTGGGGARCAPGFRRRVGSRNGRCTRARCSRSVLAAGVRWRRRMVICSASPPLRTGWVQRMGQQALNPWRTARPEEKLAALRRFDRRKAAALLSHAAVRRDEPERAARGTPGATATVSHGSKRDLRLR